MRARAGAGGAALPRFEFEIRLDDDTSLPCLSAVYRAGRAPSFTVSVEGASDGGAEHTMRTRGPGRYVLARGDPSGQRGAERVEEVAAVLITQQARQ